jgi:hypothetical protein
MKYEIEVSYVQGATLVICQQSTSSEHKCFLIVVQYKYYFPFVFNWQCHGLVVYYSFLLAQFKCTVGVLKYKFILKS